MDDVRADLHQILDRHRALLDRLRAQLEDQIVAGYDLLREGLATRGTVFLCGNGGSAADAQHFAAELVGRLGQPGSPLPALSLAVDTSVLTALANDLGYEEVFARQIEGLAGERDVLVALSTSGRSPNILRAVAAARRLGSRVVVLTGSAPDDSLSSADVILPVPSEDTQRVQEMHELVLHVWAELLTSRD